MPLAGKDGWVQLDATSVAHLDTWSLSSTSDTTEVSPLGERASDFINTKITHTGSFGGSLDLSDGGQLSVLNMFSSGGTLSGVSVHLGLIRGDSTDGEIVGNAIITGIEVGSTHTDKVTFSANFQMKGELQIVQPVD